MSYKRISPQPVEEGGTGAQTLTGVLTGNGTSAFTASTVTEHGVVVGGASNAVTSTAVGTADQVLTSNGAGSDPTFQDAAAGDLVLLSSQTASASASIIFNGLASYETYFLVFSGVRNATNTQTLNMEMSDDDGATWKSTGYKGGCLHHLYNGTTFTNTNSTTSWILTGPLDNSSTSRLASGTLYITNANLAIIPYITGTCSYYDVTGGDQSFGTIGGVAGDTGANAFRLRMSSGNILAGEFSLYGVEES